MVGFTAEGQIWEGDQPVQGLHLKHREHVVAQTAAGGETIDLLIEAAANPIPPWSTTPWPLLMPDYAGPAIYRLGQAELAVVHRDVEALFFDLRVLAQLLDMMVINTTLADNPLRNSLPFGVPDPDEARGSELRSALVAACAAIDVEDVAGSAPSARAALAPALARTADRRRATCERRRSRAHRLGLVVADPRDEAQVRAHVLERAAADGGVSRSTASPLPRRSSTRG